VVWIPAQGGDDGRWVRENMMDISDATALSAVIAGPDPAIHAASCLQIEAVLCVKDTAWMPWSSHGMTELRVNAPRAMLSLLRQGSSRRRRIDMDREVPAYWVPDLRCARPGGMEPGRHHTLRCHPRACPEDPLSCPSLACQSAARFTHRCPKGLQQGFEIFLAGGGFAPDEADGAGGLGAFEAL